MELLVVMYSVLDEIQLWQSNANDSIIPYGNQ